VDVREAIPPHMGLGSGTKLGLAIARGLAELAGIAAEPEQLAAASGRAARSSVGAWTFASPGLVVEAGVADEGSVSPLVARHRMPERWRCVLALPLGVEGLSGDAEQRFFGRLRESVTAEPSIARLLVTALLPGLLAGDIDEFGVALTQIQREMGSIFATQQGGIFHPRAASLVEALQTIDLRGKSVLDAGTGSGILAIAAARLGAARALGIDDDPDAIQAARENLVANPTPGVAFEVGDLRALPLDPADVVTANLTGSLLVKAAAVLLAAGRPGGLLVLSGLMAAERDEVVHAFRGTQAVWERKEDEWVGLVMRLNQLPTPPV